MQELRSSSTRESILDTAEALFAQQGHDGTSMRQITGAAGVNLASVNYHFGSKESLVQAVLKRRLAVLNTSACACWTSSKPAEGQAAQALANR